MKTKTDTITPITSEELKEFHKLTPKWLWLNNILFRLYIFWHKYINK